jgi:T5SS/PEP-CTERM-associated repeat protein
MNRVHSRSAANRNLIIALRTNALSAAIGVIALGAMVTPAAALDAEAKSRESQLGAGANARGLPFDIDSAELTGFGIFNDSAGAASSNQGATASSGSSQNSSLTFDAKQNLLTAEGVAAAIGDFSDSTDNSHATASSDFTLLFDVKRAGYDYKLTVSDGVTSAGLETQFASAFSTLFQTNGPLRAFERTLRTDAPTVELGALDGPLPAGSYQFRVRNIAEAETGTGGHADSATDWKLELLAPIFWANPNSGIFQTGGNWTGSAVPSGDENATIDVPGTYTVQLNGSASHKRLHVNGNGTNVTLDLNGKTYRLEELHVGGLPGDNVTLTLADTGGIAVASAATGALGPRAPSASGTGSAPVGAMHAKGGGTIFIEGRVISTSAVIDDGGNVEANDPDANWTINDLSIGDRSRGTLTLSGGAQIGVFNTATIGDDFGLLPGSGGNGSVFVSGTGTRLFASFMTVGDEGSGGLTIIKGTVSGNEITTAEGILSSGLITVTGAGGVLEARAKLTIGGFGDGTLKVEDGGHVITPQLIIGRSDTGEGEVIVNSAFISTTGLEIGVVRPGISLEGTLTVTGAPGREGIVESAGKAIIGSGGKVTAGDDGSFQVRNNELVVDGELRVTARGIVGVGTAASRGAVRVSPGGTLSGNGRIFGNVVVSGGTNNFTGVVGPGSSPGILTVEGEFTHEPIGLLVIEIGGTAPGQFDVLNVIGNASIAGDLELAFIDGFAPRKGDRFDFLPVSGTFTGDFANVTVLNLEPGFQFNLVFEDGRQTLVALSDGVFVPEPAAAWLIVPISLSLRRRRERQLYRA